MSSVAQGQEGVWPVSSKAGISKDVTALNLSLG